MQVLWQNDSHHCSITVWRILLNFQFIINELYIHTSAMKNYLEEIFGLKNKVAIVTGAAMGIGKGIAISLAQAGAKVLVADIVAVDDANETMNALKKINEHCSYLQVDLSETKNLPGVIDKALNEYNDLNILVNNAGIFRYLPMLEMTEEMWDKAFDLNLKAAAFLSKEAANAMKKKGHGGRIINISSLDAIKPTVGNLAHYDSSKAALRMFTKSLAKEVAPFGILVNDIAPGAINTPGAKKISGENPTEEQLQAMEKQTAGFAQVLPLKRIGEPSDIGHAVVFFAGDASTYITGTTLIIDGGFLLL